MLQAPAGQGEKSFPLDFSLVRSWGLAAKKRKHKRIVCDGLAVSITWSGGRFLDQLMKLGNPMRLFQVPLVFYAEHLDLRMV